MGWPSPKTLMDVEDPASHDHEQLMVIQHAHAHTHTHTHTDIDIYRYIGIYAIYVLRSSLSFICMLYVLRRSLSSEIRHHSVTASELNT